MKHFGQQIKILRDRLNLTQEDLADAVGVGGKSVHNWEKLATGEGIAARNYRKLAEALKMTTEQLDALWGERKLEQTIGDPIRRGIPIINKAPAGVVQNYDECGADTGIGHWYIDREGVRDPNAYGVVIVGDSMEPSLLAGDIVIFAPMDPDGHTHNGRMKIPDNHIMYVRFSPDSKHDGCTVARLHREKTGAVKLVKDNKKYKPLAVSTGEIANLGAMIRLIRDAVPGATPMYPAREQLTTNGEGRGVREGQVHPDD